MAESSDFNGVPVPPVAPPPPPGPGFGAVPPTGPASKPPQWYEHVALVVAACLLCWPIGIALVWIKRDWSQKTKWIITGGVVALGILLGVASAAAGSSSSAKEKSISINTTSTTRSLTTSTTRPVSTTTSTTVAPTTTSRAPQPAPTAPPATSPPAPAESVSQRSARQKASQYLGLMGFSRSGLITQLEYEGFSNADASYGVDAVGPDWNAQAAKKAAQYVGMMAFSHSGLVQQLQYEGFSPSQAEYGVGTTGL